jgi:hypothetical protein
MLFWECGGVFERLPLGARLYSLVKSAEISHMVLHSFKAHKGGGKADKTTSSRVDVCVLCYS